MNWLVLAGFSAIFLGLYDVAKKSSLQDNAVLPVLCACSLSAVALLLPIGLGSLLVPSWLARFGLLVGPLSFSSHLFVLLKAGIVTCSWVLTFFAIKHLPISLASPIRASAPLFTVLGAVLLFGEQPSVRQLVGIGVILLAYGLFSVVGRAEGIRFEKDRWVWMLMLGTLVGAASGLYDKHLLQSRRLEPMSVQFWFSVYNALLQALIVVLWWVPTRKRTTPFAWRTSIVLVAGLLLLADNLYFRALAIPEALVSVVSTIRRSNVVISFAIGALLFRERHVRAKAVALGGVLVGLLLLLG
jgi:bacterial/archaeal transporter family protein